MQHNTLDLVCCGSHSLGVHLSSILCTNHFGLTLLTLYERLCVHPIRNLRLNHQQTSHSFQYFMKISSMLSLIFLDSYISVQVSNTCIYTFVFVHVLSLFNTFSFACCLSYNLLHMGYKILNTSLAYWLI